MNYDEEIAMELPSKYRRVKTREQGFSLPRSALAVIYNKKNHANKKALQIVGGPLAPNKFLGKDPDPMMQALLV